MYFDIETRVNIMIRSTEFVENFSPFVSELMMHCQVAESTSLSLLNSNVQHTILECSVHAMFVDGYCNHVNLINTRMRLANLVVFNKMLLDMVVS